MMRKVPKINRDYWQALVAASVFGTNTGDFFAGQLHLGHLAGLPWLALLFVAIVLADRGVRSAWPLAFWAVIITVRTAATNVGDAFKDFHVGFPISVPAMLVLFALAVALHARRGAACPPAGAVRVDASYWICMMLAGVLGTLGGDCASFLLDRNHVAAAALFGALALVAIVWYATRRTAARYWASVALIRTAGTAAGDALAHALGLPASTALTGVVFLALVAWSCAAQAAGRRADGTAAT